MRMLFLLAAFLGGFGTAAAANDERDVSAKILSSIALVTVPNDAGYAVGTAWCFWSTATKSYFLTNQHVVASGTLPPMLELAAFRDTAGYAHRYPGRLFAKPGYLNDDLAVIVVDVGNIPVLGIQSYSEPDTGTAIGIAGYPSFEIEKAQAEGTQIFPSVHFGHVNSTPNTSGYIEYDAVADHGNSGGPLFDAANAAVVGVVQLGIQSKTSGAVQNNLAIPGSDVDGYLDAVWLPHYRHVNGEDRGVIPCRDFPAVGSEEQKTSWCGLADAVR